MQTLSLIGRDRRNFPENKGMAEAAQNKSCAFHKQKWNYCFMSS